MAAKKKAKKTAQRVTRYVDAEGMYLAIDERSYDSRIAWYDPVDGEFGLYLANEKLNNWENDTAIEALRGFFKTKGLELPFRGQEFSFETMALAREALRHINARLNLNKKEKPLPDWAKKALDEGWKPPKGWIP
jgi:hypothetical protein